MPHHAMHYRNTTGPSVYTLTCSNHVLPVECVRNLIQVLQNRASKSTADNSTQLPSLPRLFHIFIERDNRRTRPVSYINSKLIALLFVCKSSLLAQVCLIATIQAAGKRSLLPIGQRLCSLVCSYSPVCTPFM